MPAPRRGSGRKAEDGRARVQAGRRVTFLSANEWRQRGFRPSAAPNKLQWGYGDWEIVRIPGWLEAQAAKAEADAKAQADRARANAEGLAAAGREPYFRDEINTWGDVSKVKLGWTTVPRTQARSAPEKHTIVTGWNGSERYGYKPAKEAVVPTAWWEARLARKAEEATRPKRERSPDVAVARKLGIPVARLRLAVGRHGDAVVDRLVRLRAAHTRREADKRKQQARRVREARSKEFAKSIADFLCFVNKDEEKELADKIAVHAVRNQRSVYYAVDLDDDEKAALAARAYIRHEFTSYEDVLGDARRSCHHEDWEVIRDEAHWDAARFLRQRRTGSSAASGWCANGPGQASR